jgi:predicted transposase YbfD/YdcC
MKGIGVLLKEITLSIPGLKTATFTWHYIFPIRIKKIEKELKGRGKVHGRIEIRKIWTSTELNSYLHFPHVGQGFVIERESINKKTGEQRSEIAYGITSCTPAQSNPQHVLKTNRGHWSIENSCHYIIDWNYDEDRSRIRTGYGPENMTRLRRFAIGIIKSKGARCVAQKMRQLTQNVRLVFDYLRMTKNSCSFTPL